MIATSVWSLLIPSMEMAEANGQNSALILGGGFIIGALFLLFLDHVIPHQHLNKGTILTIGFRHFHGRNQ